MKTPSFSVYIRVAFVVAVMGAAYGIGRWQGTLENEAKAPPGAHGQNDPVAAARARAFAKYLEIKKQIDSGKAPHPAADILLAKDPKGGLEKLAQLPPGAKTQDLYQDAFATWAKNPQDAPNAAAAALTLPDGLERTAALKGLTQTWAESDAQACLDWADNLEAANPDLFAQALLAVGTGNNNSRQPALAAQYVDELQDASVRNDAIQKIGTKWATDAKGQDAPAALAWLDQEATGESYGSAVTSIFSSLSPSYAATLIDNVTDPDVRDTAIGNVTASWSNHDPAAALTWVQGLSDTDETTRDKALDTVVSALAMRDPAAAAAFVQNSADPSVYLAADSAIAETLAPANPQAALAFASNLPDGDAKNQAINNALATMAHFDFTAAWNYATGLSADDNASAMSNLVSTLANKDPAQAAGLLDQLPDGAVQLKATATVASALALQDVNAFTAWVNGLPSSDQRTAAVSAALQTIQSNKSPYAAPLRLTTVQRAALVKTITAATGANAAP